MHRFLTTRVEVSNDRLAAMGVLGGAAGGDLSREDVSVAELRCLPSVRTPLNVAPRLRVAIGGGVSVGDDGG